MAKIVFFCRVERDKLETVEFYRQDIDVLRTLGHEIIICTNYYEIPRDFDAIFIWWWSYALWPVLLSRMLKKPSIITGTFNFRFPDNFKGIDYFKRPYWQRLLIRQAACMCTLNLFVNEVEMKACSEYFKLKNGRYFPHILHSDYMRGAGEQREMTLLNIAWSGKGNLIRKGIPELLNAIRILKDEGIKVHLNLAGHKGDGVDDLFGLIKRLDISRETTYLGEIAREDKIKLLRKCEIYVQPSHYEGFGVAIAEAMGCGACVIVCDVGAVREVVGDCGLYVSTNSPEGIAKAIKEVLNNDNLRCTLQNQAQKRVKDMFTVEKKLERMKNYLSNVGVL